MRSSLRVHWLWLTFAGCLLTCAPAAHAQSLFDALFGGPKPAPRPHPYAQPSRLLPPGGINHGQPYAARPFSVPRAHDEDDLNGASRGHGNKGGLHTVCVRMCDGYYWPVSFSTTKSRLYRDANVCSSSCNSEAKLFHYPIKGGQIEDAVDLTGRAYSRLPTAFMYRKARVDGCSCKPEPWSDAEIARHRVYAQDEEAATQGQPNRQPIRAAQLPPPQTSGKAETVNSADAEEFRGSEPAAAKTAPAPATATPPAEVTPVASARPRKSGRQRQAEDRSFEQPARNRSATMPRQTAMRAPRPLPQTAKSYGSPWGGGQQYTWPGDAPVRVR